MSRLLRAACALVLVCGLGLAGCSDQRTEDSLGAAEPARAPEQAADLPGSVVEVGALSQGIVYDQRTDTLAVAVHDPYRLLLLDPTTLEVRRSVDLPGKVRHLQLAGPGGPVLVPDESANQLLEVPIEDGEPVVTDVPEHPHDATAGNGYVVTGNEFDGSISIIKDGQVLKTIADLRQPGGVVADGHGHVAVVDVGAYTTTTYDLRTMERISRLPAGEGPTHGVLVRDDRLAVTDTRGGHVILYSIDPLEQLDVLDLPGSPYGLTADLTTATVWVTLTAENKLVGYDYSTDTPTKIAEYDTVQQPDTVAVAPGAKTLWVSGTKAGVVQRITR